MNLYTYVDGDPVNWADPWGLMRSCPSTKQEAVSDTKHWRRYSKRSGENIFHCGYCCYLEKREITDEECPEDGPLNECCYDENDILVTKNHPYADCRGTPDYYDPDKYPVLHTIIDPGGIFRSGWRAYMESNHHRSDQAIQEMNKEFENSYIP